FHVQPTENDHHDCARQNESKTSQNAAPKLPFQISDIDRKLKRLRARKHMAESHDLDEPVFGQPMALFHHMIEHHRDLRHRPADIAETEKEKKKNTSRPGG